MGRKPNPRGKDRTRTISLDGDVAEIAQNLADKSQLSKVLSQLLRTSYGISDDISRLEATLNAAISERKALQQREEDLIKEITEQKERLVNRQNHILPSLYQRQGVIEERLKRLTKERAMALNPTDSRKKMKQITENTNLLNKVLDEIKELEIHGEKTG